jgi:hypothetical protein
VIAAADERLAMGALDVLLSRLQRKLIDRMIGGRRLRAAIETTRLRRHGMRVQAELSLSDVTWGGWPIDRVCATAASVALDASAPGRLVSSAVDVVGVTKLDSILALAGEHLTGHRLYVDREGQINLVRRRSALRAVIGAVRVDGGSLAVDFHAVAWRGLRLALPRSLRRTYRFALPPLPLGVAITEARREGEAVDFRLSVPSLTWPAVPAQASEDSRRD